MKKLINIIMIVCLFLSITTYSQVIEKETLNDSLVLRGFQVKETAKIFNDFDRCKDEILEKDSEIGIKTRELEAKTEQLASLVKVHYYSQNTIRQQDLVIKKDKEIEDLQKLHIKQIETIQENYQKQTERLKTEKWLDKWVLKPVIFVGGIFLGTKL